MYSQHTIIGNLGHDPSMRYTPTGQAVCSFSVAVNRRWTNAEGQPQDEVTWYRVQAWGKLAEACAQYLAKGRQVLVSGDRIKANPYTTKAGEAAATLELTAQTVKFLGGGSGNGEAGGPQRPVDREETMTEDEIPF